MLFDKNGFYIISPEEDYDFAVDIMNGRTDKVSLFDPKEALMYGNTFKNLYSPYKSYAPVEPKVKTEREKSLLEIQRLEFVINDLNLYLDIYPDDLKTYHLFCKYVLECKKKKDEYKRVYGPLCLDDLTDTYEWSKGVWPWEEGGM